MEVVESKSPSCDLLYPEILSHSDIVNILKKRCIKIDGLEKLEKHNLVELFYKYILPLPQRKYRLNRRGRLMTKNQIQVAKKRKLSITQDEGEPVLKKKSSGLLNSFDLGNNSSGSIKTPVTCINMERKTIKLSSSKKDLSTSTSLSSSVSKIKLTSGISQSETEDTKERKKTIVSISDSGSKTNSKNKTISIINKHLTSLDTVEGKCKIKERNHVSEKSPSSVETEAKMDTLPAVLSNQSQGNGDDTSSPKKKFKISKISWP